jgi:hypothetical protein
MDLIALSTLEKKTSIAQMQKIKAHNEDSYYLEKFLLCLPKFSNPPPLPSQLRDLMNMHIILLCLS